MSDKSFIYGLIGGVLASYLTKPKQQPVQQTQLQQQLVRMPHEFNYVVDLYSNEIEITDQSGSKTTLNSIDDLNDWLGSITDKDILIWNHGDMTGTIELTSNRYVIIGKPTKFKTLLTQSNIDLYYLTPSQFLDQRVFSMWYPNLAITNYDIENQNWFPISNVNIFATGASIFIYSDFFHTNQALQNIHVTAIDSPYISINGITGGVISTAYITIIEGSELTDGLIIVSNTTSLYKIKINNYLFIESNNSLIYEIDYSQINKPFIDVQGELAFVNVMPNQTVSDELPIDIGISTEQVWEITGIYEVIYGSGYNYYLPLSRSEVNVQLDLNNKRLSITNNTSRTMSIVISFRSHSLF